MFLHSVNEYQSFFNFNDINTRTDINTRYKYKNIINAVLVSVVEGGVCVRGLFSSSVIASFNMVSLLYYSVSKEETILFCTKMSLCNNYI